MSFNVEFDSKEIEKWVSGVNSKVPKQVAKLIKEAVLATEADAKRLAPVDQGPLRQGIFSKANNEEGIVSTSPQTPYALHVHKGHMVKAGQVFPIGNGEFRRVKETRFIQGQPFMLEAFEANEDTFMDKIDQIINRI